jgi:hypothetical protein
MAFWRLPLVSGFSARFRLLATAMSLKMTLTRTCLAALP